MELNTCATETNDIPEIIHTGNDKWYKSVIKVILCLVLRNSVNHSLRHTMVPTSSGRQISLLTFSVSFSIFFFQCSIIKYSCIKKHRKNEINCSKFKSHTHTKNNNCLKFSDFSSILCKIPWLFQYVQNSLTGKCSPIFPVDVGTMHTQYNLRQAIYKADTNLDYAWYFLPSTSSSVHFIDKMNNHGVSNANKIFNVLNITFRIKQKMKKFNKNGNITGRVV